MNPHSILPQIEQQLKTAGLTPHSRQYHNARRMALVMALCRLLGIREIELIDMLRPPVEIEVQR